jgi:hypothetical protein
MNPYQHTDREAVGLANDRAFRCFGWLMIARIVSAVIKTELRHAPDVGAGWCVSHQ